MTKNLITGIGGFVASHLADYLLEQGEEVFGTYRWTEDLSNIEHIKDKITLIPMDLNDLSSCIKAIEDVKPDYVFHLAAQSFVPDSFVYPVETIRTNTIGTFNLLEAIRMKRDDYRDVLMDIGETGNVMYPFNPVIHVCSSSEVYGSVPEDQQPITENTPLSPNNPYAIGKIGADMTALWFFKQYGLKVIRTRMFTHTSGRRKMMSAECFYAKEIVRIERGGEPIIPIGNLDSIRTWAHAEDAVRAYYILVREGKYGEVYNIGGDHVASIREILDKMIDLSRIVKPVTFVEDPKLMRKADVKLQKVNCSKFKKLTGWRPVWSLNAILEDVLDGWRKRV